MKTIQLILLFSFLMSRAAPAQQTEENHTNRWHPPEIDRKIQAALPSTVPNVLTTNAASVLTFEQVRAKAEKGDADAQFDLGNCYYFGQGVIQDYAEAVKLYWKAAEQGYADAQQNLGVCYFNGQGIVQDYTAAVKWFGKAAQQGNAAAQFSLGQCYGNGKGVPQNYAESVRWYRKAAEQGYADAQNNLGGCYAQGQGVPQDYVEAYKWFNLAAAQGQTVAINNRDNLVSYMTLDQIAGAQELSREFVPRKETPPPTWADTTPVPPENSPIATGTGFFITADGYLISNYHVVKDAVKVRLLTGAGMVDAKVVQVDAADDLALLKADGRFAPLPILPSKTVQLGSTVATIGFPDPGLQGFAPKLAKGIIAGLAGAGDDARYFQVSVPVQPGNSGGALLDEKGNVVGIVSAKLNASAALAASGALPENVNYAVKSSFLLSFLESVPGVEAKLKKPNTADEKFEDVVKSAQAATVLVLVY